MLIKAFVTATFAILIDILLKVFLNKAKNYIASHFISSSVRRMISGAIFLRLALTMAL